MFILQNPKPNPLAKSSVVSEYFFTNLYMNIVPFLSVNMFNDVKYLIVFLNTDKEYMFGVVYIPIDRVKYFNQDIEDLFNLVLDFNALLQILICYVCHSQVVITSIDMN